MVQSYAPLWWVWWVVDLEVKILVKQYLISLKYLLLLPSTNIHLTLMASWTLWGEPVGIMILGPSWLHDGHGKWWALSTASLYWYSPWWSNSICPEQRFVPTCRSAFDRVRNLTGLSTARGWVPSWPPKDESEIRRRLFRLPLKENPTIAYLRIWPVAKILNSVSFVMP